MEQHHRDLLSACTGSDENVLPALERFLSTTTIEHADDDSHQLFSYLHKRLLAVAPDHPARSQMKVHHHETWRRNQILVFRAKPLLAKATELGFRAVVLKGGGMTASPYYGDLSIRPMADLDVLIPMDCAEALLEWALANEWTVGEKFGWDHHQFLTAHHAVSLMLGNEGKVDLHVGLLSTDRSPELDNDLINNSIPADLGGAAVHVLPRNAHLMHTLSHSNPTGYRHIADALFLLGMSDDPVDWEFITDQIMARRSIANSLVAVELLNSAQPGAVPDWVLARLKNAKRHWSDWSYQGHAMASIEGPKIFASRLAQRSRGQSPMERAKVAKLLVSQYAKAAGITHRASERPDIRDI